MLHKKTFIIKLIASLLCLLLTLPTHSITALNLFPGTDPVEDGSSALSEVLDLYFESRTYSSSIRIMAVLSDITNPGMPEDEVKRMQAWQTADVLSITNSYIIDSMYIGDVLGDATVTETITYAYADYTNTQSVVHYIKYLYDNETNSIHILMDSYTEPTIVFTSCSYLPEYTMSSYSTNTDGNDTASNTPNITGDFINDIVQIALSQIGYQEKNNGEDLYSKIGETAGDKNWTKYNNDIGYDGPAAWCASFVAWCAQEAGLCIGTDNIGDIPSNYTNTVIPNEKYVPSMANYYKPDRYYSSSSFVPQVGDLCFMLNKEGTRLGHVGLVVEVDIAENKIYTVEGNSNERVERNYYTIGGTAIVAYATPNYEQYETAENSHLYQCEDEEHDSSLVHTCTRCGKSATATMPGEHTPTTATHSCSLCDYTETVAMQKVHKLTTGAHSCPLCEYADPCTMTLEHDTAEHWYECSICHEEELHRNHIWISVNGINECRICGAVQHIAINKIKLPIVLLTE